jgi:acylphosphatase
MKTRILITVTGRVQGVSFRKHTALKAEELGIKGWVTNLPDGSMQGYFEGDAAAVDALFAWCSISSEWAHVYFLTCENQLYTGEFHDFRILQEEIKAA